MAAAAVGSAGADHEFDNDGALILGGVVNAYTATTARRIKGFYTGLRFCGKIPITNTLASTIIVDEAPAAVPIRKAGNVALAAGDLVAGTYYDFIFDEVNAAVQVSGPVVTAAASLTAGDGIVVTGGAIFTTIKRRNIADISSGDTMVATDRAKTVNIASGTGTLAFTAAATLGDGWWAIIKNSGTGNVTLNPDAAELIDGLSTWVLYPGGSILVQCDGSNFFSVLLSPMQVTFDSSGTFTKPGVGTFAEVEAWGAGGSGGQSVNDGGGGGGGGYNRNIFLLSALGTTETVTIGAGGAAQGTASTNGIAGGQTSFGSLLNAFGGGGGAGAGATAGQGGGGGGGITSAGATGSNATGGAGGGPAGGAANTNSSLGGAGGGSAATVGGIGLFGGGGGGGGEGATTGAAGGQSIYGGGGGGGGGDTTAGAGGASVFGGNGGAGGIGAANGTAGTVPGGGGGGCDDAAALSGAGAGGRCKVRVW